MSRDIQEFVQGFGVGASIGNAMNKNAMQRDALEAKAGPPNPELERFDRGEGASLGLGKRRGVGGALGRIGRGIKGVFGGGGANTAGSQQSDTGDWGGYNGPEAPEVQTEYFAAGGPVGNEVMGPDGYPLPEGTTFSPSGDWEREGTLERLKEGRFPQRLTPAAAEETGGPAGGPGRRVGAPGMDEEQGYRNLGDDDGSSPEYPPSRSDPLRTAPFDLTGPGIPRSARDDAELERNNQTLAPQGAVQRTSSQQAGSSTPPGKSGVGGGAAGSTGSGGAATSPSQGGRKPLRDQTRSEAFDPQADKEDPDNVVGKILDGGLSFASHIFHMNDDGTVTRTGGTGGAIQRAPAEGADNSEGKQAFMSGVGAATPQEIAGLDKLVQQKMPDDYSGDMGRARLAIRRMEIIYRHASMTGQTDKANKMAFEIMQFSAGEAARLGSQAVAAYKSGNIPQAIQLTAAAHNEVPDGTFVKVDPSGKQATLYNVNTGKPMQQMPITPEFLFSTAMGYSNRTGYWNAIVQRAIQTNPALQKAAKAEDPLQQEKTRTQIDLNRARTQRALRPPVGRAAKPGPQDLPPEIQSQIDAIDSKRTRPSAPAGNGGGEEAPVAGHDTNDAPNDERVADAEARTAAAEEEAVIAEGENDDGGNASEAGGKEPGQSSALPPNSVLRTNSRPGQGVGPTSTATPPGNAKTHDGLPARQNADGTHSTELSITVTNPRLNGGKPTNIPSMWGGQELDEEGAVDAALKSGQKYASFKTVDEAVGAAKARSSAGGAAAGPQGSVQGPAMPADREKPQFDEPNPTDAFEGKNPYTQILGDTKNAKYFGSPAGKAAGAALKKKEKEFNDDVKGWTKRKGDFEKQSTKDDKAAAKADGVTYKDGEKMDTIATNIASDVDTRAKDDKTASIYSASGDEKTDKARQSELSNIAYQMHTANKNLAPKQAVDLVARLGRAGNGPEEAKLRAYTPVARRGGNITLQLIDDPTVKVDLPEDVYKRFDRLVEQRWKTNVETAKEKAKPTMGERAVGAVQRNGGQLMTDVANYLTGAKGDGIARDAVNTAKNAAVAVGSRITPRFVGGTTLGVPKGALRRYNNSDTVLPPEGT